jgi:3-oxoacyl-[acyl-carrier protein] reductase
MARANQANPTKRSGADSGTATLAGRVALVTGASRGIGRAIALELAGLGAAVAICGRDKKALESTAAALRRLAPSILQQTADVTRPAEIDALVSKTEITLGPISILVNNAGVGSFGAIQDKTEADWDLVLNTNLKSVFLMSRAVVPSMIRQGSGDIVNISSLAGKNTFAGGGIYCASKWGLRGLSGCMAEDLRNHNIRVSVISPGSVATDFGHGGKASAKALEPDDVAHAVALVVTQRRQSFVSEVDLRPLRKS